MDQQNPLIKVQQRFEGKISCECGNSDWRQFLYVGDLPDGALLAGCKKCARIQNFDEKDSTGQSTYKSTHS